MKYFNPFKSFFTALILTLLSISLNASVFYVSPTGNDSNAGTSESPFLSIERAKRAVYQVIQKNKNEDCIIWLANGLYPIENPLVFSALEFGNSNAKITIKAESNAHPVISGGKLIKGWKKNREGLWEAKLKISQAPRELFVGHKRAVRARFPNEDYLRVKKVGDDRRTHFYFNKNEFPVPELLKDVELVLLHDWSISRIGIQELDVKKNKLTAVDSIGAKNPDFFNLDNWEKNPRYFLENALEFLDVDYEWVYNSIENKILLKLPINLNPKDLEIVIPVSEGLVQIQGSENKPLYNIHFEGISFQHCAWQIPDKGYCGVQACHFDSRFDHTRTMESFRWTVVPAAISLAWAKNCSFSSCSFQNLGTSGLWFSTGCNSCSIKNSLFNSISGNGIMVGEGQDRLVNNKPWWQEVPEEVATGNTIENCVVKNCGVQFYGAVGIWCGLTAETLILNNEISDLPYSGISIGWMWSPVPTPCRANVIDGNHIHHILNILSDGGGIYSLGLQPGSKIVNNHIHDVKINAGRAESNGMFLDEGTTDVVIAGNLIYNIAKSPLRFHKATTNLVKENYLFCTNDNPPIRYNRTEENDIRKEGNLVLSDTDDNYKNELEKIINTFK